MVRDASLRAAPHHEGSQVNDLILKAAAVLKSRLILRSRAKRGVSKDEGGHLTMRPGSNPGETNVDSTYALRQVAFRNASAYRHVDHDEEDAMAQEPLATKGNFLHIYDFRVMPGHEAEFIRLFEQFDYSDGNPMHKSAAQVKDGVLCRDTQDPQRFFLIAEWSDIEEHARIRKVLANE